MSGQPSWVDKLVPPDSVREALYTRTVRRRIRSHLFWLRTAALEGVDKVGETPPRGFKAYWKKQEWFDGWDNFATTWDVGDPRIPEDTDTPDAVRDPLQSVPRWQSIEEEWDEEVRARLKENEIQSRKNRRQQDKAAVLDGDEDNV